jgi:hypothetical protein
MPVDDGKPPLESWSVESGVTTSRLFDPRLRFKTAARKADRSDTHCRRREPCGGLTPCDHVLKGQTGAGRSADRGRTPHHRRPACSASASHWRWRWWSVAYRPDWEPLADALRRVITAGVPEPTAKIDLCRAVADRKIDVRVRVASSDPAKTGKVFSDGNVGVPPHLDPDDFDWVKSRPLARWSIGPRRGEYHNWIDGWEDRWFDLIEVSTADVVEILCGSSDDLSPATIRQETAAIKALASHLGSNPQLTRAQAATWCSTSGYVVSPRGFQNRVWPKAREQAGLPARASPGRKPKSLR